MPQADPLDLLPKECKVRHCYQFLFFSETMVDLFGQGRLQRLVGKLSETSSYYLFALSITKLLKLHGI